MMGEPSVLVAGAGPTGLMLAAELALAGVSCRALERRSEESNLTRAFGVHARTLELLDLRGEADKLIGQGLRVPAEVVGLRQDDTGVEVDVTGPGGGRTERADYVVGCGGAHSAVRRLVGVGFVGSSYDTHIMLADVAWLKPADDHRRVPEQDRHRAASPVRRRLVPGCHMGPRTGGRADR